MMVAIQVPGSESLWLKSGAILFVLFVIGGAFLFSYALRRYLRRGEQGPSDELGTLKPSGDSPTAFMAASMQAVIQKLREQEKELETLHRLEKERAEQTERLSEAVTRNMPAGLLLLNSSGLIISANPAAETALGVQSLAYRRYTEALGPDSALSRMLACCLAEGRTFRREEIEYTTPSSELRQLGMTISPILRGSREVAGALCLLSDLTELTLLQKQIHMKENLAALGELSAGIARGELGEHAERILDQTRALTHVVTEFLKFARPLELADEEVPVRAVVERVVAEVREAIPQVEVITEGEFAEVSGDEGLLRQAILNLARNAAEAASGQPFGGRVTLRGAVDRSAGHDVQRISIFDNGPGIPAQDLPKIFLPFYTTKANGTGLGLAVVLKIVVQHGGGIEARNQPEGGAEFILWLPLQRKLPQAVDSAPAGIYTQGSTLRP